MAKILKYKDLIKKLKPFENNEIVMVASNGEVSFFDKAGMFNIIHLSELENEGHCFVTGSKVEYGEEFW